MVYAAFAFGNVEFVNGHRWRLAGTNFKRCALEVEYRGAQYSDCAGRRCCNEGEDVALARGGRECRRGAAIPQHCRRPGECARAGRVLTGHEAKG